jgi:hypothetical protein
MLYARLSAAGPDPRSLSIPAESLLSFADWACVRAQEVIREMVVCSLIIRASCRDSPIHPAGSRNRPPTHAAAALSVQRCLTPLQHF